MRITFYFKFSQIFLFLNFSVYFIAHSQNLKDSLIYWDSNSHLQWSDFKVIDLDTIEDLSSNNYYLGAISNLGSFFFGKGNDDIPNIIYYHYFNRNNSWVTKNEMSNDLLLHEQLHFDISELYARKIRKELDRLRGLKVKNLDRYYTIIDSLRKELKTCQEKYDDETGYGSYKESQMKWNKKIAMELSKLRKYEMNYLSIGIPTFN